MEQGAFLPFYEQHKETLYHYACTLTANAHQAEDALQNAWVSCLRQEEVFDALPPLSPHRRLSAPGEAAGETYPPGISAPVAAVYPAGRLFGPGRRPGGRRGRGAGSGPAGAGGHPQPGRDLFPERDGEHRVHLFALLSSDGKREVPALQFREHCPGKGQCDRRERGMVSPHFPSNQDLSCAWGNRSGKLCIEQPCDLLVSCAIGYGRNGQRNAACHTI